MTCGGKVVILSAPSGAGKTTLMKYVVENFPQLEFSVSATSRGPRAGETHGRDYFFITEGDFTDAIDRGRFVEWEEVYKGTYYGTLVSELERIWAGGKSIIFDVDVKGGINLKRKFGSDALAIFIMPPSVDILRSRLRARSTDSEEVIEKRVAKAETEIADAVYFDQIIVNDDLETARKEIVSVIGDFLGND